jgi:hypothetical protein
LLRDFDDLALTAEAAAVSRRSGAGRYRQTREEKKKQHRRTSQGVLVLLRDVAGLWETPQVSERWHYGSEIVSWFAASVMVTAGVIYTP